MKLTGENRSTRGKTCPSATLSTTNPTWTEPGSNPVTRIYLHLKEEYKKAHVCMIWARPHTQQFQDLN
jgi:hypothetical protein